MVARQARRRTLSPTGCGDVVKTARVPDGSRSAWAQYAIETPNRDALKAHLQEKGIPSVIYYVKPLHQQVAYRDFPRAPGGLPVSEALPDTHPLPADAPLSVDGGPGPHHRDDPQFRRQQSAQRSPPNRRRLIQAGARRGSWPVTLPRAMK